jgi:hypothetical protein
MTDVATTYIINLPKIKMIAGFNDWCIKNIPLFSGNATKQDDPNFAITFIRALTDQELADITAQMQAHSDPPYWLSLAKVESMNLSCGLTNTSATIPVNTFIFCPNDLTDSKLDSLKILVHYQTLAIENFINFDESTTNTLTIELFCMTRNIILKVAIIDINSVLSEWKTKANNSETGEVNRWKTSQLYNMHTLVANYDCVWQFRVGVSNPLVYVALDSLERIFYDFNTT